MLSSKYTQILSLIWIEELKKKFNNFLLKIKNVYMQNTLKRLFVKIWLWIIL